MKINDKETWLYMRATGKITALADTQRPDLTGSFWADSFLYATIQLRVKRRDRRRNRGMARLVDLSSKNKKSKFDARSDTTFKILWYA